MSGTIPAAAVATVRCKCGCRIGLAIACNDGMHKHDNMQLDEHDMFKLASGIGKLSRGIDGWFGFELAAMPACDKVEKHAVASAAQDSESASERHKLKS